MLRLQGLRTTVRARREALSTLERLHKYKWFSAKNGHPCSLSFCLSSLLQYPAAPLHCALVLSLPKGSRPPSFLEPLALVLPPRARMAWLTPLATGAGSFRPEMTWVGF